MKWDYWSKFWSGPPSSNHLPYIVYASREGPGKTAWTCSLLGALAAWRFDKHQNITCWPICSFVTLYLFAYWVIFKWFFFFCRWLNFFKIYYFKKFFQEYHQSVKQFGSRSGLTFCHSLHHLFLEKCPRL